MHQNFHNMMKGLMGMSFITCRLLLKLSMGYKVHPKDLVLSYKMVTWCLVQFFLIKTTNFGIKPENGWEIPLFVFFKVKTDPRVLIGLKSQGFKKTLVDFCQAPGRSFQQLNFFSWQSKTFLLTENQRTLLRSQYS